MADFKLSDVSDGARVFLVGARERCEELQRELCDDDEFNVEEHWGLVDHFSIDSFRDGLWTLYSVRDEEAYPEADNVSAEEIVDLIHKLSKGVAIDRIEN